MLENHSTPTATESAGIQTFPTSIPRDADIEDVIVNAQITIDQVVDIVELLAAKEPQNLYFLISDLLLNMKTSLDRVILMSDAGANHD